MALPSEAIAIQKRRDQILVQVEALKKESRELKQQYDMIVQEATLKHKLGSLSDSEKEVLRQLLA